MALRGGQTARTAPRLFRLLDRGKPQDGLQGQLPALGSSRARRLGENLIPQHIRKTDLAFFNVHLEPAEPTAITTDVNSTFFTDGLERILAFRIVVISEGAKINDKR